METEGDLAAAAPSARRRWWAAESARYYAQQRFNRTETPKTASPGRTVRGRARKPWRRCRRRRQP